jgi:hypothetical protein
VEFYTTLKRLKTEVKMFPKSISRSGGLLDIVLHPDYAKMVGFTSPTEGGGEGNTKLIRAKLENESLSQIESLYKCEKIQPRDSILVPNCI